MTIYNARVWPPGYYPATPNTISPVTPGPLPFKPASLKIGPAQVSPVWPKIPFLPATNLSKIGPAQVSPVWPGAVPPAKTVASVNFTPATSAPNTTTYLRTTLTLVPATGSVALPKNYIAEDPVKKQINSFFNIISSTPGSGK